MLQLYSVVWNWLTAACTHCCCPVLHMNAKVQPATLPSAQAKRRVINVLIPIQTQTHACNSKTHDYVHSIWLGFYLPQSVAQCVLYAFPMMAVWKRFPSSQYLWWASFMACLLHYLSIIIIKRPKEANTTHNSGRTFACFSSALQGYKDSVPQCYLTNYPHSIMQVFSTH